MVTPALLTLPGGRPARTPGERQYAQALVRQSAARSQLKSTVEAEREAHRALVALIRDHGPAHAAVEDAVDAWRTARRAKKRAAAEVDGADEQLDASRQAWASEAARSYAEPEARNA